jgi:hypothetical protein
MVAYINSFWKLVIIHCSHINLLQSYLIKVKKEIFMCGRPTQAAVKQTVLRKIQRTVTWR